jgi:capsular exopolysaccharide synthesis family protein
MSKIFEALNRQPEGIAAVALSPLAGNGNAGAPTEPCTAPVSKAIDICNSAIRTLPLRIPGAAPVLPFDGDHWEANEQYRILRTRLIHHSKQPRMIVVSSAGSGDGKSITTVNLAGALSLKTESKVLLVDADFRRSTIHTQLGLPKEPGLAEVLRGACILEEALVQTEQLPNLYVLPSGESKGNPAELLDSSPWPALCTRLRQMFRYVILDSPPIAAVADYDLIQAVCDGVILILRPDHTNRKQFQAALELIPKDKLIGAVLNCVPNWFLGRYSSPYYYGDYRRYGKAR